MGRPNGTSLLGGLPIVVMIAIGCFSVGFALYSLSEWMTSSRLYTGGRGNGAWRTHEQDPNGFVISALFCVAFVIMPVWYVISKRGELFGGDDTQG